MFTRFGGTALICFAMVCVGCGTTVVPEGEPAAVPADANDEAIDPLEVTDALRAACYLTPDAEIRSLLQAASMHKSNGYTHQEVYEDWMMICSGAATAIERDECAVCSAAVLQQVYGP